MKKTKFASIDIGSNAIRLLIANVYETKNKVFYRKCSLLRVPIRLGLESFIHGEISKQKQYKLTEAMKAFKILINIHEVSNYMACATSALREAKNGKKIIKEIYEETDIKIESISGKEEASIIFNSQIAEELSPDKDYLYVDVGGGSTEITLFSKKEVEFSASFNIGTLKLVGNCVPKGEFLRLKECLLDIAPPCKSIEIIGTGGNINKIAKMKCQNNDRKLTYNQLVNISEELKQYSTDDLILNYDMNPDRADVIIPALTIFLSIMEWSKSQIIHMPKIGVSDGLIHMLYTRKNIK
ncbi:MAG: hypothetical protein N4A49_14125 [Marinifilaceae bacterium]|jgi:exopolyphosphatase/guanosine-5'-triphosphate,3'-diphosphate pyrophosphatase|nr:hypothetical protein [Marinifilaceae bacterium]